MVSIPSVAVIIPIYNHARYIERTLASVFAQTLQPSEIIVVDDNSTDGSYEILQSYVPRITLIRKPAGALRGPAASQNLALSNTRADYIAFLDSDDLWMPEKLAKQVAALEANPDAGLCYCNGIAIDDQENRLYQILRDEHREPDNPASLLIDCYIVSPSKVLVRRSLFDQVGVFRDDLLFSHDHECWVRMREVTRFIYVPEILMGYRRHPQQGSLRREMWDNGFLILREAIRRYPYDRAIFRKRWAVLHYRIGEYFWKKNEAVPALYNFILSAVADPVRAAAEISRRLLRRQRRGHAQRA